MLLLRMAGAAVIAACVAVGAASAAGVDVVPSGQGEASAPLTALPDDGAAVDPRDYALARHGFKRGEGRPSVVTASGQRQFVYSSPTWSCVADQEGSATCADEKMIASGRSFGFEMCVADLPSDQIRIRGLVSADATQVKVQSATYKKTIDVALGATVFEIARAQLPPSGEVDISWATGQATVFVPPRFAATTCG